MATYYITRWNKIYSICTFLFISLVCTPLFAQQHEHIHGASCTSPEVLAHNEAVYQKIEVLEKDAHFLSRFNAKYNFSYLSFAEVNSYFIQSFKWEIANLTSKENNVSLDRIEALFFELVDKAANSDDLWFEIPADHGKTKIYYGKHTFNPLKKGDNGTEKTLTCYNAGFENQNWDGWETLCARAINTEFEYDNAVIYDPSTNCSSPAANTPSQHAIFTAGNTLGVPHVFNGAASARLGNGPQAGSPNRQAAVLRKTFILDHSRPILTYSYAAFLDNGGGHPSYEQPFFNVQVTVNGVVNPCATYRAYANDGQPGWERSGNIFYRDWTTIAVPLHSFPAGSVIELEFSVSDCSLSNGTHYAYAFVDVSCDNIDIERYCSGTSTVLRAPTDGIVAHQWVHSGETTPEVTITSPGTYQVWVLPYGSNCSALLTYEAELFPAPTADFSSNLPGNCVGGDIIFTNTSSVETGGTITGYRWSFGDGISTPLSTGTITGVAQTTGTYVNPTHTYTTVGTMPVTLYMETSDGCSHQVQQNITIVQEPNATINGNTTVCAGAASPEITFTGTITPGPFTFTYNINGGAPQTVTTASGQTSVTIPVPTSTPGTYVYNLTRVEDLNSISCQRNLTQSVTVVVNPIPNATIATDATVCQGDPAPQITFTGSNGTSTYEFTYSMNGGAQQTIVGAPTASVNASTATPGTFEYVLHSVEDVATGCSQVLSGPGTISEVIVNPMPNATITGTTVVCQQDAQPQITFTGTSSSGEYTFTYNINGGANQTITTSGTNVAVVNVPTTTSGTFTYQLVSVSDPATGCTRTINQTQVITVNPLPTATITGTVAVCQGEAPQVITFTGSNGTSEYQFTYSLNGGPNQTITTSGSNSVTITVPTTIADVYSYTLVSVEDVTTGCEQPQTGTATVTINPMPTVTITGGTVVCQQDAQPQITITGSNSSSNYSITYNINGGAPQTVTTSGTIVLNVPTGSTGTFTYTVTHVSDPATGCNQYINQTQTVTVNPLPTATISGTVTVCQGDAAPVVTFTGNNSSSEYRFTYSLNGGPNQTITTNGSNTATITVPTGIAPDVFSYTLISVEDVATGCGQPQTGTATVTINPMPDATIAGTIVVCQNDAQPQITFTGTNSSGEYVFTYSLNGDAPESVTTSGSNTATVNVPTNIPGTFTYELIHVHDPATGCGQDINETQVVTVNPLPTATISGTVTVCQGDAAPVITFTGSNALPGSEYEFTYSLNGGPNQTITTNGSNSVTITVPTTNSDTLSYTLISVEDVTTGCGQPQTGTVTVIINPMPDATITGTTVVCQQDAQPQITFTGTNSSGNYTFTYSLNGGANQTITTSGGANTATINVPTTSPGTFTYELIHVSDPATGCGQSVNESQTVTVNPLPTATIAGTVTVCQGDAAPVVTFTGSNALPGSEYEFTYSLNGGPNQTITTNGSNSVTITVPTTNSDTLSYTLISVEDVTTGCGQPQTGTVTVIINPMPDATITGTTVVCQQDAQPQITFTGTNSSGNYTFTYSLNGGANQTITTSGGANTATINVPTTSPGTFTYELIHVSDPATGCGQSVNESQTVTVNPLPTATIAGTTTICQYSAEPQITFTGNAGTSDYEFTYSINGGTHQTVTTSGTNTVTINVPTGTATVYTYTLHSVRDIATNCFQSQTGTVTITVNPTPTATTAGTVDVCQGSPAPVITFTGQNSLGGYTFSYRINNGPTQTVSAAAPNISATVTQSTAVPGTYVYELINVMDPTSLCNQDVSLTETIVVRPLPTTIISNPIEACYFDSPLPEVTFSGVNGGNPYTFAYNINGGPTQYITSTGATATLQIPTNAVGTFVYTVTNIQEGSVLGCQQPQNVSTTVTIHNLPVVSAGSDFSVCAGVPIILTGAGASTYTWDHGVINGAPFTPSDTTTYTVTGTDHNGCQNTDQITVNVVPIPVMSITGQNLAGCQPVTPIFTNTSTGNLANCTWYLGNGDTLQGCGTVSSTFTNPGCFDVTLVVTTPEGCTNTLTMSNYVCVDEKPVADFYPNPDELTSYNWETQMINETTGASYYEWDFGDNSAISHEHSPYHAYPNDLPGVYNVRLIATSPNGCIDTAYAQVTLKEELIFYVPNTFTPDGDDFNETFKPVFTTGFDPYSYSLFIYNRWGEMVFESHDTDIGWNGRYGVGGNICQDGTYTWKIEVKKRAVDERLQFVGHVNIIR